MSAVVVVCPQGYGEERGDARGRRRALHPGVVSAGETLGHEAFKHQLGVVTFETLEPHGALEQG